MESSSAVEISLVRGKSPLESFDTSQESYKNWIRKLLRSKEIEAPYIIKHLLWNMSNQVIFEIDEKTSITTLKQLVQ